MWHYATLGIIITKDLKWQKQTEKRCRTANRVLGFIAHNCRYKIKELILPLYKSLVRPHLEHAVQFWSPLLLLLLLLLKEVGNARLGESD